MVRAPSPAEFLAVAEKSKLLAPDLLEPYRGALDRYPTADALADAMTAEGLLTRFQADHLRQGKWQGFFLGTYKMLEKLGAGGSSIVYLAEHVRLKQRVAVKVLSYRKAADAEALGRFEREAKAAAAVRHPNVVHAFDFATSGRLHYMVMEYINGPTLLQVLTDSGRMAPRRIAKLMHMAAQGLHAAHQAGIVHRDVKPSNLMIDADGTVKVTDLGLARYDADENELTQGKAVLGLVAYTAPEQMRAGAAVDARADVYALGATFYLAATGKRPPVGGAAAPDVPARDPAEEAEYRTLMGLIGRMMAATPEDRHQSMADVTTALTVSGLLAKPKAKAVAATSAPPAPAAPSAGRPAIESPALAPRLQPVESVGAVVESDEVPLGVTPLPERSPAARATPDALAEASPAETLKLNMGSFDFRVLNLLEDLGDSRPLPDPDAGVEPIEFHPAPPPPPPAANPRLKWAVAGGTFAAVLVLLFLLAR